MVFAYFLIGLTVAHKVPVPVNQYKISLSMTLKGKYCIMLALLDYFATGTCPISTRFLMKVYFFQFLFLPIAFDQC